MTVEQSTDASESCGSVHNYEHELAQSRKDSQSLCGFLSCVLEFVDEMAALAVGGALGVIVILKAFVHHQGSERT